MTDKDEIIDTANTKVKKVEIIEKGLGRAYVVHSDKIQFELQDDGKTLKVFIGYDS